MENSVTSHIIKGVIIGSILILFSVTIHSFNLYEIKWVTFLIYLILFLSIIISCLLFVKENKYSSSFGDIFAHGFKTTSVSTALLIIYTLLAIKFLFPEILEITLKLQRKELLKQMVTNPKVTNEIIDQYINMTKKNFIAFAIGGTLLMNSFIGAIASVIGAAVAKKNSNPFENTPTI